MIDPDQVHLVRIGDHRVDAVIPTYDTSTHVFTRRLAAWAVRDAFGWAVMTRSASTDEIRTVSRVDWLPDFAARPVVAGRLVRLAAV